MLHKILTRRSAALLLPALLANGLILSGWTPGPSGAPVVTVAAAAPLASTYATGITSPVAIKATPSGRGWFVLSPDGGVHGYGDAVALGSAHLPHNSVSLTVTKTGHGYWVFDSNGCAAAFGDATPFTQSICTTPLNGPVLDAATTPGGHGYWLIASDGGVFSFGDAPFLGSMGGKRLNGPVVGMAPTRNGNGYWEVARDGGIFSFGAPFLGSMGSMHLNKPVVGMVASGSGYMMVASDGGIFNFGNPFFGSLGSAPPPAPVRATAASLPASGPTNGYWMLDAWGIVYGFGSVWMPSSSTPPAPPPTPPPTTPPGPPGCGLIHAAFCDTFDAPAGRGDRAGDLNGLVWGVSRATSWDNPTSLVYNWAGVSMNRCGTHVDVLPPSDVQICNGQVVEATNDNEGQTVLAMYPRQPFDFAGRTGTVVFDVSNNAQGSHAAWPVFVLTDQPVPAPLVGNKTVPAIADNPRNSFGVSFAQVTPVGGTCVGVDQMWTTTNYQPAGVAFATDACVAASAAVGVNNHIEIHVSATSVQVFASDAGLRATTRLIAHANLSMPLTRGLAWMEDVHYNGDKFNTQRSNTFSWDNFGFDGPVLARDLGFDVPYNTQPGPNAPAGPHGESSQPTVNIGQSIPGGGNLSLTIPNVTSTVKAGAALLEFNSYVRSAVSFTYSINGHPGHTFAYPFGGVPMFVSQTFAMPVTLSDLHDGNNTLQISTSDPNTVDIANISLILAGAG